MSWDMETTTEPVARKDYHCEASDWIDNSGFEQLDYSDDDWAIIQRAKAEEWKILKGTKYIKTTGKWDGDFSTFRARIDLDKICRKYDMYETF